MKSNKFPSTWAAFLLLFPVLFNENFTGSYFTVYGYALLILAGLLGWSRCWSRWLGVRWRSVLAVLVFLEILICASFQAVRYRLIEHEGIEAAYHLFYTSYLRNVSVYQPDLGRYDPELFYRLRPGEGINKNLEFSNTYRINSAGLRDGESDLEFPEIIVLGDSHAMGFGVDQHETFPEQLQEMLSRKTLNASVMSYGTARQYLLFQQLATDSCHTLIWQYCPNDAPENRTFLENGEHLPISSSTEFRFCQHRNFLQAQYYPGKYVFESIAHGLRGLVLRHTPSPPPLDPEAQSENFFAIVSLLRQTFQGDIVVVNLENKYTGPALIRQFDHYIQQHDLPRVHTLDLSDRLGPDDFYVIDEHLNASGHRKVALALRKLLRIGGFKVKDYTHKTNFSLTLPPVLRSAPASEADTLNFLHVRSIGTPVQF